MGTSFFVESLGGIDLASDAFRFWLILNIFYFIIVYLQKTMEVQEEEEEEQRRLAGVVFKCEAAVSVCCSLQTPCAAFAYTV